MNLVKVGYIFLCIIMRQPSEKQLRTTAEELEAPGVTARDASMSVMLIHAHCADQHYLTQSFEEQLHTTAEGRT